MNLNRVKAQKLGILLGAVLLQSVIGTISSFPAYSSHLKHLLSLSTAQINFLVVAFDAAKILGFLPGLASNHFSSSLPLLYFSSFCCFLGHILELFLFPNQINFPLMMLLNFLTGFSFVCFTTVCNEIVNRNFGQIAVGLSSCFVSLSGRIYVHLVGLFVSSSSSSSSDIVKAYFLVQSISILVASVIVGAYLFRGDVRVINVRNDDKVSKLVVFFDLVVGLYALISSFIHSGSGKSLHLMNTIIMGTLLLGPILILMCISVWESYGSNNLIENEAESRDESSDVGPIGWLRNMVDLLIYWFMYLVGITPGLVYLYSLAQISGYTGGSYIELLVSVSSSFGYFGRFMPSLLDFFCLLSNKNVLPRPALMAALMIVQGGAFFLLLLGNNVVLLISTLLISGCTGAMSTIATCMTADLFGKKHFPTYHNIVVASIPIGDILFGYLLTHYFLLSEECMGIKCYNQIFIIWGSLTFLGAALAFIFQVFKRKIQVIASNDIEISSSTQC